MLKNISFSTHNWKEAVQNLVKHYRLNGLSPRSHGNIHRKPWNAASFGEKERAVVFIKNYADVHAMPLPGRLPKHNDFRVMLLPSDVTKRKVYDYVVSSQEIQAAQEVQVRIFGYREFCRLWSEITCPKPRVPKRKQQNQDVEETAAPAKKRARLCSHCKQPGHTKTKKGVVTCPLLLQ